MQALFVCPRNKQGVRSMYYLRTSSAFDSAHFLSGYNGKCGNIHGHRWKVEAVFCGSFLNEDGEKKGMLIDFGDIKKELRAVTEYYDHALIYEKGSLKEKTISAFNEEGFRIIEIPLRPTAENLARLFYDILREKGLPVCEITVYETPENCASYKEG